MNKMLYLLTNMNDIRRDYMNYRKIALHETGIIAIGVLIGTAILVGIFALLGKFTPSVLLGGIIGAILTIANFFVMAVISTLAADRAEQQDTEGGKKLIKSSYPIRLLVLAVLLIVFAKSGFCNVITLVLPLAFVRPTITISEFFRKNGE